MKKKTSISKKVKNIATKKNAAKAVKSTGGFLAENKKELFYVVGAVVIGVVGYKIYKGVSKGVSSVFDEKSETVNVETNINKSELTISKEQSQQFAKTLLDACNAMQPFYGTDEDSIKNVFVKLKSADDFKMVYKEFGMKNYNGNNSPPSGWGRHFDNYAPRDLIYWLKSELDESDGEVYEIVKSRIESAGYRF